MALLEVTNVKKIYSTRFGGNKVQALSNVTFSVEEGEYVAIMGESGSGKTTLLNLLSTIDRVTAGHIYYGDTDITELGEEQLSEFRKKQLGFIFQEYNLLDTLTLEENIMLVMTLHRRGKKEIQKRCRELLRILGIEEVKDKYPYQVSGGQKQRVAVASAIASERPLIVFDEPTSGLDLFHMRQVAEVVNRVAEHGRTVVVVTHDPEFILRCCNFVIHMEHGEIQESYSLCKPEGREHLPEFFLNDME